MVKLWSELPTARLREVVADGATAVWLVIWGSAAWSLYSLLAQFAEAGRLVRGGGERLQAAGEGVGEQLARLPLVGDAVAGAVRGGFHAAGVPIADAGRELETFVIVVSATLALLLALVPLVPWLAVYLPWRLARIRRLRAGQEAVRRPRRASIPAAELERVLAARALNRLDWPTLLEHTPDPIGDWHAGRFDRLAGAELEQSGLRV